MSHFAVDFESTFFPKRKIGLKHMGVDQYLWHPDVEIYLASIHVDGETLCSHPMDIDWGALDGEVWVSHNAAFDRRVWRRLCHRHPELSRIRPKAWHCTANLSVWLGYPRDLKGACLAMFNERLDKDARKIMENKSYRELRALPAWHEIVEYAERDAQWCWKIWEDFSDKWPQIEKDISEMTTMQCLRGLPADAVYIDQSIEKLDRVCFDATRNLPWANGRAEEKAILSPIAFAEECRKLSITPPRSLAEDSTECQRWERENAHISWVQDMRKYRKANLLKTKFQAMRDRIRNGRIDFSQKYCGAHTRRASGDQKFNVHGFQRDPFEGVDMRRAVHALHGGQIIIADLAQIEPRTLAWMVEDKKKIAMINQGISVYQIHAAQTMGWTGGVLKKEDAHKYALSKMRVLGLSYGCGGERFVDYCWTQYGHLISLRDAKIQVNDFRRKERLIVNFWNRLQNRLEESIGDDLEIELPSWNSMKYRDVRRVKGQISATLSTGRINRLWGSLLAENIIQATARDCFFEKLVEIEKAGIPTLFAVHDECITDEIASDQIVEASEMVGEIMAQECSWMPGVALDSELHAGPFYKK